MSPWEITLVLLATAMAAGALVVALLTHRAQRRSAARAADPADVRPAEADPAPKPLVAFVANASKPDVNGVREQAVRACAARYLPEPLWLETTPEDTGLGQARQALREGADIVVAVGGDGTVRQVARALAGTDRTMGLIPLGTGNLLARNLDIPVNDPQGALDLVLGGRDRAIDVGWLEIVETDPSDPDAPDAADLEQEHIFLVIAGMGFDAAMVADTDDTLKARVGWLAYFVAGFRHLHGRRLEMDIALDDARSETTRLRTLLVGNCGRLPGGITLLPDALVDDGVLDIAAIDTRGGIAGWAQLFGEVVMQGFGLRNDLPNKIGRIDHARARTVTASVRQGAQTQVDGEVLGRTTSTRFRVDPGVLTVRGGGRPGGRTP